MSKPVRRRRGYAQPADPKLVAEISGELLLPQDIQEATVRAVGVAHGRTTAVGARLQGAAYVTHQAHQALRLLEAEELDAVRRDPINQGRRQRALNDTFTYVAGECIADAGQGRWR